MTKIKNSVVWLTGASSGIGEALAYQLAEKGARLILSARRKEELERVKNACTPKAQEDIRILPLDLADHASLEQKITGALAFYGQVDVLINGGGISQRDRAINTSLEVDRQIMEVNYFGSIALSKGILKSQVKQRSGHHVVISSAVGIISSPLRSAYSASKHALHGFYDALRAEHHRDNIKVSVICPGYIRTNISKNALMGDGRSQGTMDDAQTNGISPEKCAAKIIKAIETNKEEVYIAGARELAGIYTKRFIPGLFSMMIRKVKVT